MNGKIYENVAIISGIEPHRTILQSKLLSLFLKTREESLIIEGKPDNERVEEHNGNVTIVSHLNDEDLRYVLINAKKIYCRSGYSTLMDLYALNIREAILIPTPGQTEQEYLAQYFQSKGFTMILQNEL